MDNISLGWGQGAPASSATNHGQPTAGVGGDDAFCRWRLRRAMHHRVQNAAQTLAAEGFFIEYGSRIAGWGESTNSITEDLSMHPPVNRFRRLSAMLWLVVLAGSIGYTVRGGLLSEELLSDDVQNVAAEFMLASESAAKPQASQDQIAAQAMVILEAARSRTLR